MLTTVAKWGNSAGIRLPKAILQSIGLKEQDNVSVSVQDEQIIISKANTFPKNIQELFKDYDGDDTQEEIDWGEPQGKEIW